MFVLTHLEVRIFKYPTFKIPMVYWCVDISDKVTLGLLDNVKSETQFICHNKPKILFSVLMPSFLLTT